MNGSTLNRAKLRRKVSEAIFDAIGKSYSLIGHIKAGCPCQTCSINRALRKAFRQS